MESSLDDVPSTIWRISNYSEINGFGGLRAAGRWHTPPRAIMYCSDDPVTAFEEVRHYFPAFLIPDRYRLLEIKVPRDATLEVLDSSSLDASWNAPAGVGWKVCQTIGNEWHASSRSTLLKVPSARRPNSFNFLVNSVLRQADGLKVVRIVEQPFSF